MPSGSRRRTQIERTTQMRQALLQATFDTLVESGVKGTTTTAVAHRAGASLGALQHHFPTKADLLTAAVTDAFGRRIQEYRLLMTALDPTVDKRDAAIDLLWSLYRKSTFTAWQELWAAARTDADLAAAVVAIDREFMTASERVCAELFPEVVRAQATAVLHLVLATMSGLATAGAIEGYRPLHTAAVLDALKLAIRPLLAPRASSTPTSNPTTHTSAPGVANPHKESHEPHI